MVEWLPLLVRVEDIGMHVTITGVSVVDGSVSVFLWHDGDSSLDFLTLAVVCRWTYGYFVVMLRARRLARPANGRQELSW